jgi:hypothetical protein
MDPFRTFSSSTAAATNSSSATIITTFYPRISFLTTRWVTFPTFTFRTPASSTCELMEKYIFKNVFKIGV